MIVEIHRNVDVPRNVRLSDIKLVYEGREEISGMECSWATLVRAAEGGRLHMIFLWTDRHFQLWQVLPEEFAAIQYASTPHVEQVHGQHSVFEVISENIGVIAFNSGNALLLL